jgi:hypothetical protein
VAVRVRPLSEAEKAAHAATLIATRGNALAVVDPIALETAAATGANPLTLPRRAFAYDHVFANDKQDVVFNVRY